MYWYLFFTHRLLSYQVSYEMEPRCLYADDVCVRGSNDCSEQHLGKGPHWHISHTHPALVSPASWQVALERSCTTAPFSPCPVNKRALLSP